MSTNVPEEKLQIHLRRIGQLMRTWPGELLDSFGSLRLLNGTGTKPPIFWCFNNAARFPALANALGPDQPLIGMRSLNQILDPKAIIATASRELGEYYAEQLLRKFGPTACIVGGNCQAASISYWIALALQKCDAQVLYLVTLDAELHRPFAGEVRKLFGQDSHIQNPFFAVGIDPNTSPALEWRYAFSNSVPIIIGGGHGHFFDAENITSLAQAISAPSLVPKPNFSTIRLPYWRVVESTDSHVFISTPKINCCTFDFAVLPLWERGNELFRLEGDTWMVYPSQTEINYICKVKKPDGRGGWTLRLVVCQRDAGPIIWPLSEFQQLGFEF